MFEDKSLTCKDCGNEFVFSAGEQEFYSKQGFNEPVRCKACRDAKKARNNTRSNYTNNFFIFFCILFKRTIQVELFDRICIYYFGSIFYF